MKDSLAEMLSVERLSLQSIELLHMFIDYLSTTHETTSPCNNAIRVVTWRVNPLNWATSVLYHGAMIFRGK